MVWGEGGALRFQSLCRQFYLPLIIISLAGVTMANVTVCHSDRMTNGALGIFSMIMCVGIIP